MSVKPTADLHSLTLPYSTIFRSHKNIKSWLTTRADAPTVTMETSYYKEYFVISWFSCQDNEPDWNLVTSFWVRSESVLIGFTINAVHVQILQKNIDIIINKQFNRDE